MAKVKWKMSLALILSGMLGAPAVASAHASGRITEVIRFVPHSPGRGMLRGYCWTGSIAIARPDAWRCMAGNEIFDPCFEDKDKGFVVCDPNPAKGDPGLRMKLTKPLPEAERQTGRVGGQGAWLVELADGTTCRPRTGTGWEVQGKIVNYYCESSQKGIEIDLLGELDSSKPLWTAEKASIIQGAEGPNLINLQRAAIKRVWR